MHNIEWKYSQDLIPYQEALEFMQQRVAAIAADTAKECVWFLEHPPLYTAGTSAKISDLLAPVRFPVYEAGRGGQYTYHGPGQRVVYVMLNLKKRHKQDVRLFVQLLEQWIINTLQHFDIKGETRPDRIGVWVKTGHSEAKIAALGIRLRKWISFHGIAINISPNLNHFLGIVPCGIKDYGVTSFEDLGIKTTLLSVDKVLKKEFIHLFLNEAHP